MCSSESHIPAVVVVNTNGIFTLLEIQGDGFLTKGIVREGIKEEVTAAVVLHIAVINKPVNAVGQLAGIDSLDILDVFYWYLLFSGRQNKVFFPIVSRVRDDDVGHLECIACSSTLDCQHYSAVIFRGCIGQIDSQGFAAAGVRL